MDLAGIREQQRELANFMTSGRNVHRFRVDSPLSQRIAHIYRVAFPGAARLRLYGRFAIARLAQTIDWSPIKVALYRSLGIRIGRGVFISPEVILDVHFPSLLAIDDYVILGWGAKIACHEFYNSQYRIGRVRIGEGALIGAFAAVRGGVEVGRGAEVPYGMFVHRDVPAGARPSPGHLARRERTRG